MPDRITPESVRADETPRTRNVAGLTSSELRHLAINNGYKTWQPSIRATGLRSSALTHRTLGQGPSSRIAEQYLLASRMVRGDVRVQISTRPYFNDDGLRTVSLIGQEDVHPDDLVQLPAPTPTDMTLSEAITSRRSRRDFVSAPLSLQELADLIGHSAAETGRAHVALADGGQVELPLYAAANGGGLRPIDLYVLPLQVDGLAPVVHRYDRRRHALVRDPAAAEARRIVDACVSPPDQEHLSRSSVVFVLTGRPWRSMRKYGARGLRFLFVEAGHLAAATGLTANALGLGAVECGSLCDDEVHELLGIDGLYETYIHSVIVGKRAR
jgi:SagB-type dehydrogenase family enzyme